MLDRVLAVRDAGGAAVEHVVVVESQGGGTADGVLDLDALEGAREEGFDLEARWRAVGPDDLLTLIYTSGTTGPPKGVEITHANMLAEWNACRSVFPDAAGGRAVSFLPAAHIADRWSSHYGGMVHGPTLTCVRDPREVMAVVAQVRPTPVFGAVPRVWEKVKAALEAAVEADPDEARRAAVRAAIETGLRRVRLEQAGEEVGAALAEAVAAAERSVFAGLRERLGLDAARFFVSGAASSLLIGQAVAIGDRRPYNVALLTLDPDSAAAFAARHGLADASAAALIGEPAVREEVAAAIERANEQLSRVEQLKHWTILATEWEPGGVDLTPTMKLRRRPIAERYAAEIEALYAG